jgi:hypothetical protein
VETYRRVGGPVEEAGGMEVGRWMWPSGVEAGQWRREADGGGRGGWAMGSGGVRARAWAGAAALCAYVARTRATL